MDADFKVGDKVVCVTDNWSVDGLLACDADTIPIKDRVYSISGFAPLGPGDLQMGMTCAFYLVGVRCKHMPGAPAEAGWDSRFFRKIWTSDLKVTISNEATA